MRRQLWSSTRVLAALVLGGWAGFFWWLWLSGRYYLFVGARTSWVVPTGAICLTIAAAGRFATSRVQRTKPLRGRQALLAWVLLLPAVTTLALPPATLGAPAAASRGNFADAGIRVSPEEIASGELTLLKIAAGQSSDSRYKALLARSGETATLIGFVTMGSKAPPHGFELNRFVISCCVADALVIRLPVEGLGAGLDEDDWVQVTGQLAVLRDKVTLKAVEVKEIETPAHPYIRA